ncbi:hypothetical protein THMIRHAT_22660 [Thiosulfativibrio zosterae]|uniref:Uncharacterized protein n=1 Tax=Thiosulfativibrio zosterae TaxID=2675053 RepID=A0A6F8PRA6_9GAMM|nr:hypothetical protein THMIRHAT_22660 [Thiosulfativibrio zosterae]
MFVIIVPNNIQSKTSKSTVKKQNARTQYNIYFIALYNPKNEARRTHRAHLDAYEKSAYLDR